MKRFLKPAMWGALGAAFAALTAMPALAADPYYNGCEKNPYITVRGTATPVGVAVGKYLYMMNALPLWEPAIIGRIDRENPELSEIAVTFKNDGGILSTNLNNVAVGLWVAVGSTIRSLAVPKDEDIKVPDLPFALDVNRNLVDGTATYNGMQLMAAKYLGVPGYSIIVGTQVMDRPARRLIAEAIISGTPFELGARSVRDDGTGLAAYKWEKETSWLCYRNWNLLTTQVLPAADPSIEVQPISGTFAVSNGKVIVSAPPKCDNTGTDVACPITAKVGALQTAFRFEIPTGLKGKVWFRSTAGVNTDTLDAANLPNAKLVLSVDFLDSLLGTQEEVSIDNLVKVNLVIQGMSGLPLPVSFIEKTLLKRLTYGVAIDERDTSALGRYSGSIGQDPDITIPLTIRQFGASKATQIKVQVVADSVATSNGSRCKFVGNGGATVVGIPANVRFYSGTEFIDRPDNCNGITHDITTMKWREALGGAFPYMGSLDMDLVFPLSPTDLNLDVSGKAWLGTVEATGEVRVSAEWK